MKIYQYLCLHIKKIPKVSQDRLLFEIYTPKIFEIFVGKNTKTIEFIKNQPTFFKKIQTL